LALVTTSLPVGLDLVAPLPGLASTAFTVASARTTARSAPILLSLGPTRLPTRQNTRAIMMSNPTGPIARRNCSPAAFSSGTVVAFSHASEKALKDFAKP